MSSEAEAPPELGAEAAPNASPPVVAEAAAAQPSNGASSEGANANDAADSSKQAAYEKTWLKNFNSLRPCIKEDGTMDYSSLDADETKRMQNFVKHQRKCYMKRENNEPSPMTDERIRMLSELNFDFKPSETTKAKAKAKKLAKEQAKSAEKAKKKAATPKGKSSDEDKKPAAKPKKSTPVKPDESAEDKSPKPAKEEESDSKMPASSPKSVSNTPVKSDETDSKTPADKSPKSASKGKKSGKPTYLEMVHEAIVTMKDRTGSSIPAISKWIVANHQHVQAAAPNMVKSRLNTAIKQGLKDGRFTKVKNSYKINAEWTKKQKAKQRAAEAAKKKAEKKRKAEQDKAKKEKDQEKAKKKAEEEKKRKEKEMTPEERAEAARRQKLKEEAEAKKRFIEQQLRKRRYPIEDTRLHRENKEWGVKAPEHVERRPKLPHTLTCLVTPHLRVNTPKTYKGSVAKASMFGTGPLLGGENERGLVTDAIHVYHFFCGDVGIEDADHPLPKFSIKTLLYALDEVLNGNAKAAKSLPPLLTHLFVTVLRMLTAPRKTDADGVEYKQADLSPVDLRLDEDLAKLGEGLNAVSWSQICFFYMDLMERYYSSDVSLEEGVLPGEGKLDMNYFWNKDAMDVDGIESMQTKESNHNNSYLGDPQGVLAKGFFKLQVQSEPWTMKADELMALLRTLTDDVLASRADLAEDIAGRSAKLYELSKAKRNAVMKYNKVRLAYEGPKKPSRPKKTDENESDKKDDTADAESKAEEKPFVPTATKKQFEAAEKAYHKAVEAYENGLNKLIARTEPLCFDRNFNAIYFFRHDPTMLHVEEIKPTSVPPEIKNLGTELTPFSSWHFIDTKPLFEQFLACLDSRGQRENETLHALGDLIVLKRRLLDDRKDNGRVSAREREKEDLERRIENAKSACAAEDGRRSGRLAGMAQGELTNLEEEMTQMTKAHAEEERQEKIGRDKASDYSLLTGLQMVTDLFVGHRSTRSSKKSDDDIYDEASVLAHVPSHQLWLDGKIGGNGTIRVLAEALLAVEEKCNDLSPWSREDISRGAWRKQLSDASCAWAIDCNMQLGPSASSLSPEGNADEGSTPLASPSPKKQKTEPTSISTLKLCLNDLEMRVFEASGKKKAIEEADMAAEENEEASSDEEDDDELNKRRNCWKIKINALKRVPTGRSALIRDIIVAAITVSRKSHLNQVAADLKLALQLMRPQAAGEAKVAAIKVLDKYGGYDGSDDEDEGVDLDELAAANAGESNNAEEEAEAEIASLLCDEVRMIGGSVGGDDFADKSDWSDAIKDCKSVSRLAVMIQIFLYKAVDTLTQLKEERNNLDAVLGVNAKRTSKARSIRKHDSSTAIWCHSKLTDKLVKAQVKGFPWWPAHVCVPLDPVVADALEGSEYSLISSVGNPGMFMVPKKDMVDFVEETEEDLSQYDTGLVEELKQSMAIAKKIWRVRNRGVASPWKKKSRPRFIEEKKTAHD